MGILDVRCDTSGSHGQPDTPIHETKHTETWQQKQVDGVDVIKL